MNRLLCALYIFFSLSHAFSYDNEGMGGQAYYDRETLRNIVKEAFTLQTLDVFDKYIFSRGEVFGGPCDLYAQVYIGQDKISNEEEKCYRGKSSLSDPIYGLGGKLRTKYVLDFCNEVVSNQKVFNSIYKKLKGSSKKGTLNNIYNSFYKHKAKSKVLKLLENNLINSDKKSIDLAKEQFLTVCLTEGWQLL